MKLREEAIAREEAEAARREAERQAECELRAQEEVKFKKLRAERGITCRSFALEGVCQAGRRCKFSHGNSNPTAPAASVPQAAALQAVSEVPLDQIPEEAAWGQEISELKVSHKAFVCKLLGDGSAEARLQVQSASPLPTGLNLGPMGLQLSLKLPPAEKYPTTEAVTLVVLNETVPPKLRSQVRKAAYGCAKAPYREGLTLTLTFMLCGVTSSTSYPKPNTNPDPNPKPHSKTWDYTIATQ